MSGFFGGALTRARRPSVMTPSNGWAKFGGGKTCAGRQQWSFLRGHPVFARRYPGIPPIADQDAGVHLTLARCRRFGRIAPNNTKLASLRNDLKTHAAQRRRSPVSRSAISVARAPRVVGVPHAARRLPL